MPFNISNMSHGLLATTVGKLMVVLGASVMLAGASFGYALTKKVTDTGNTVRPADTSLQSSTETTSQEQSEQDEASGPGNEQQDAQTGSPSAAQGTQGTNNTGGGNGTGGGGGPAGCPSGQVGTPPNCWPAPPAAASAGKQWKLAFNDEFSGSSLNTSKWTPCFDWNYGGCTESFNNGREAYKPSQVQLGGGTAKLVAEPMSPPESAGTCYQGSCTYKSGLISTARPRADNGSHYLYTFTYGYVEARMKVPATSGFFTAFWMLPNNHEPYDYEEEIDILELLGGNTDTAFMTYHYNNRSQSYTPNVGNHNNGACPVKNHAAGFVRYGLDWQPGHIAWYIDGIKCGQFTGTTSDAAMQLILNVMVDNNWQRSWNLTLPNLSASATLEVDYIRVYQQQ